KVKVPEVIRKIMEEITDSAGKLDTEVILQPVVLQYLYGKNGNEARWSKDTSLTITGRALINFIANARLYGLFPEDYHYKSILSLNEKISDTAQGKKDAVLWSKQDVLLTDALLQIIKDVKLGRLQQDSITLRGDSTLSGEFY